MLVSAMIRKETQSEFAVIAGLFVISTVFMFMFLVTYLIIVYSSGIDIHSGILGVAKIPIIYLIIGQFNYMLFHAICCIRDDNCHKAINRDDITFRQFYGVWAWKISFIFFAWPISLTLAFFEFLILILWSVVNFVITWFDNPVMERVEEDREDEED